MSKADGIFVNMCRDILENGYSTEGQVVRAKWADDGAPAHTRKIFGVCNRYDLSEEFPALTLRPTPMKNAKKNAVQLIFRRPQRNTAVDAAIAAVICPEGKLLSLSVC